MLIGIFIIISISNFSFCVISGGEMTLPEPAALIEIFGRLTINSFSICDEDNRSVGVGLYLAASALNHSCNPNAVAVFRGTQVFLSIILKQ